MIPGSVVLLFVFCMVPLRLAADGNDPLFENFDVSDGLPHNTVQKIFQDSAGFMWFATKDGLCRYDGQTCLSYRESLNHKSISNSKIRCMAEDAGKCIWVGTDNGLNRIDPAVGDIRSFFSSGEPLLKSDRINDLYFDGGTGFMWIATDRGISIYDTGSDSFVPVGSCRAFDSETNILLVADKVYIGTAHGLYECDRYAGSPASLGDGTDFSVFSILKDRNGDVWFGNDHTFLGKVPCGKTAAEFMFPDRQRSGDGSDVYSIIERDGVLWLVTRRNGIFLYDGVSGNLQGPFHPEPSGNTMLTCGYKDADGNIWIGSYYEGVFFWSPYMNHFYIEDIRGADGTSTGVIGQIVGDGDRLWIGSDVSGIVSYGQKDGRQEYYGLGTGRRPLDECKPMLVDDGILWVGTESHGIRLFDVRSGRTVARYTTMSPEGRIPGNRVNHIIRDSRGDIYLAVNGGPGGICRYDRNAGEFRILRPAEDGPSVRDVYFIYEIADGCLWLGTRANGLFRYDVDENVFESLPVAGREDLSISYIFKDSRQRVWAGTFGQGLICFDTDGNVTEIFDMGDGRGANNICGILEDIDGHVWVSSFYGVSRYDENNGRFVRYDAWNGFPLNHVKPMSAFCSRDGIMYFGGENGIVHFNPRDLMKTNASVPRVALTDFLIHSSPVDAGMRREIAGTRHLTLAHGQDNLTFVFSVLGYVYPEKNLCHYMLEGIDDGWKTADRQRRVTYGNLGPGRYRFLLSASNGNGIWSEPETMLEIRIRPAPWLSWWAFLIYASVAVALVALFVYYKSMQIKLEHDIEIKDIKESNLKKMHTFRLNLFTNFSHEIRTPLTLVSGSLDDLLSDETRPDREPLLGIRRNVAKIMELVNQLMDFRRHDSGRMELAAVRCGIIAFIKEMATVFGELSRIRGKPLELHLPEEEVMLMFNPGLMEKVFGNVLMNAFKYSEDDSVISISAEMLDMKESPYRTRCDRIVDRAMLVSIADMGEHIPEDRLEEIFEPFYRLKSALNLPGTGIGLSFNRMIMRLHHGDIWAENTADGVVFRMLLPAGVSHLSPEEMSDSRDTLQPLEYAAVELQDDDRESMNPEFRTLLVVEDNDEIRKYLKDKLSGRYNVVDCDNGREALEILHRMDADLVISDVMMPVMDGVELCRSIKSANDLNHIPVILLTAHIADRHVRDGLSAGADDYIFKPFNFDLLLARIDNLLKNNERMRLSFQKKVSPQDMNVTVRDYDDEFLKKCHDFLSGHLEDPEMTIEDFGKEMGVSRVQLYRKIKYLTGLTPSRFVLYVRLKIAAGLLERDGVSVSDVCYKVGFNNLSYFTRTFKDRYGVTPSEYHAGSRPVS